MNNTIYVVGIGPGNFETMTYEAVKAIEQSDLVVGYSVYIELLKQYFPQKETLQTPMTKEVDRCRLAFSKAQEGRRVVMVCSGDSGVYGMAGLMLEISREYPQIDIEIVSGVTAASAGAALLGAPLMHDFAVISLSDRLTEWKLIEKRLALAAEGDFCIVLYNPSSKGRPEHLRKACEILLKYRTDDNACGVVKNIGRNGQEKSVMTLAQLKNYKADMFTTVFIGNSHTEIINDRLVTPRGYL